MFIHRHLEKTLKNRLRIARSICIFGPRQSGKTTLVRNCFPNLPYFTLEDPDTLGYVKNDPRGFLDQFKNAAILDEPQRIPELFSYLQSQIDIEKKKFVLTSSQNFLLMASISQSLAGRISLLNLNPLSKSEVEQKPYRSVEKILKARTPGPSLRQCLHLICRGGYPEVQTNPKKQAFWFADYFATYVERDVRQITRVQDAITFQRFVGLCAGRSGSVLNRAALAQETGISEVNITRWLSILEASGIIFFLRPYHKNFNKRLVKSPKLYFVDTGLLCYLLGIKSTEHLEKHPLFGAIVETYVVSELRKTIFNAGEVPNLYYFRDSNGVEIDVILESSDGPIPIEIKASQTATLGLSNGLRRWCALSSAQQGYVLYGGTQAQRQGLVNWVPIGNI